MCYILQVYTTSYFTTSLLVHFLLSFVGVCCVLCAPFEENLIPTDDVVAVSRAR